MRLYIFGASGAGVSTLGAALAAKIGLPYFDGDAYFWEVSDPPFTVRRLPDTRNAALARDLAQAANWVLGGCVMGWGEGWPPPADLIIFLWLPQRCGSSACVLVSKAVMERLFWLTQPVRRKPRLF